MIYSLFQAIKDFSLSCWFHRRLRLYVVKYLLVRGFDGLVRFLVIKDKTPVILMTTNLELSASDILRVYCSRFLNIAENHWELIMNWLFPTYCLYWLIYFIGLWSFICLYLVQYWVKPTFTIVFRRIPVIVRVRRFVSEFIVTTKMCV